jgi:hypothetical protein
VSRVGAHTYGTYWGHDVAVVLSWSRCQYRVMLPLISRHLATLLLMLLMYLAAISTVTLPHSSCYPALYYAYVLQPLSSIML